MTDEGVIVLSADACALAHDAQWGAQYKVE